MGEKVRGAAVRQTDRSRKKEVQVERWIKYLIVSKKVLGTAGRQTERQTDRQR